MDLKMNKVKKALKAGSLHRSMVSSFRTPRSPGLRRPRLDYLIMDTEHSFFDYSGLADIFTVARTEKSCLWSV